jgi:hypothetical protein
MNRISTFLASKSTNIYRYPHFVGNLWISSEKNVENFFTNNLFSQFSNVDSVYNYSHFYPHFCGYPVY